MRAARFDVSTDLLREALHMPASATITHISIHSDREDVVVFVVHDSSLPEAGTPHVATPIVTREQAKWDWDLRPLVSPPDDIGLEIPHRLWGRVR